MTDVSIRMARPIGVLPLAALIATLAAGLMLTGLAGKLPPTLWWQAMTAPDLSDMRQILFVFSTLPRLCIALIAGAALGLAGAIFQAVLRNPLASPSTLGIAGGAKLALSAATVFAPNLLVFGREWVALAGAALATLAIFALAWRKGLSPVAVVLAGLVLGLYCGSASALLVLFKENYLAGLFIWGNGSLSQQGWDATVFLGMRVLVLGGLAVLVARPLALLMLDDAAARSLGLSLTLARSASLAIAVALTAVVVACVGVIGFIGLVAPALARFTGARRLQAQLSWSPVIGAVLLWLADEIAQRGGGVTGNLVPTGTVTAIAGAPFFLWLLSRSRIPLTAPPVTMSVPPRRSARPGRVLWMLVIVLVLALAASLLVGRGAAGNWSVPALGAMFDLMPWRSPRACAALAAGAMLAVSGCIMQRMTRNPMASPEVLGVSAGAALGVVAMFFFVPAGGRTAQMTAAAIGACGILAMMFLMGRRSGFAPERVLLAGIALGSLIDALAGILLASGDPRGMLLMVWMMGSTYGVDAPQAVAAMVAALVLLALVPLAARWLDILPLGDASSRGLGLGLGRARLALLGLSGALAAAGTLVVGPLTFVGLMAPHLALRLGLQRALPQLAGAALCGACVMVLADWFGRVIAFPFQMPAGLLTTLVGGPALMWLLARR